MEGLSPQAILNTTSFETAKQNMLCDEELLLNLSNHYRLLRVYIWKNPGITYSFKQLCPPTMHHIDHAIRPTGGGIVVHSPGDVVFAIASNNQDPKQKPTDILTTISSQIKQALQHANVPLDKHPSSMENDLAFCQTYPTPFELSVHGRKIFGLTIRQFKTNWLAQGIIHASQTHPCFHAFMPRHHISNLKLDPLMIQNQLIRALTDQ